MYLGVDFVGRMNLPLVAIGEQFTAGFGVDPQLQVQRHMMDKSRAIAGGNQVLKYEYRILASSYKAEPVNLQVWDRLPQALNETLAVTLVSSTPEISKDPQYLREDRPHRSALSAADARTVLRDEAAAGRLDAAAVDAVLAAAGHQTRRPASAAGANCH